MIARQRGMFYQTVETVRMVRTVSCTMSLHAIANSKDSGVLRTPQDRHASKQ